MKTMCCSKTWGCLRTTRRYTLEDRAASRHSNRRENLRFGRVIHVWLKMAKDNKRSFSMNAMQDT